ncbi:transcriptional regulator, XRE family [Paraburkholderia aspalathi]|uniref:Transcriptional regulator, XRE family n=2 Tax=Paraburkholderia aspalathi TaxID=1324617 RepID=A0A1I7B569_9BURK|nr:helix-turn-helix transcriptional regulator [Paraburkholderia aspalathi]SFT82317.1 transcriptional regulator, XRE family [Paraburkholderia aspalathi]
MRSSKQLGEFLRSRRTKLLPGDVELPTLRRRRAPGLRREEVAQLAGISVEWYIKLEQGRAVSPSASTISALGQALRLGKAELSHLRALAETPKRKAFVIEVVPETISHLVASFQQPAYVLGQRWDILAWNDAAADLFTDFALLPCEERNILLYMLGDPAARRLFGETWGDEARRMVSLFRVAHDLWAGDAAFGTLVEQLRTRCPEFSEWWTSHEVGAPVSGVKTMTHPVQGDLKFKFATFQANDNPALKLAIYAVAGDA